MTGVGGEGGEWEVRRSGEERGLAIEGEGRLDQREEGKKGNRSKDEGEGERGWVGRMLYLL